MIRPTHLTGLVTFCAGAVFNISAPAQTSSVPSVSFSVITNVGSPNMYAGSMEKVIPKTVLRQDVIRYKDPDGKQVTLTNYVQIRDESMRFIFTDKWEQTPFKVETPPMPPIALPVNR